MFCGKIKKTEEKGGNCLNPNETYYRRTVSAIGFALLIWFLLINVFGVLYSYVLPQFFMEIPHEKEVLLTLLNQGIYAAGYLFCFMFPVFFLRIFIRKAGYSYRPMYAPAQISPWLPLMILGTVAISFSAGYLNSMLMDFIGYDLDVLVATPQAASNDPKIYELILDFIVIALVPGFCEEFLFRGAILSNCLPFGEGPAILISALTFSLMHQNAAQIFYTFVAGLILGYIYVKTKSIWNCVLLHAVNNFISYVENIVAQHIKDLPLAVTYVTLIELVIFLLGGISIVILIQRFFSKKDVQLREGFFGRSLPQNAEYAQVPLSRARAVKLFKAPSMVIYLSLCVAETALLMLLVILGGKLIGMLG